MSRVLSAGDCLELIDDVGSEAAADNLAARYVAAQRTHGTEAFVTNAACEVRLLRYDDLCLPVAVDDGALGQSYVARPHRAYVLYARDEIALLGVGGIYLRNSGYAST